MAASKGLSSHLITSASCPSRPVTLGDPYFDSFDVSQADLSAAETFAVQLVAFITFSKVLQLMRFRLHTVIEGKYSYDMGKHKY